MLEALKKNESFSYKKLSAEEMAARGILGRLVGPCADFTIPTRNGRKYGESLWENVFSDEIVLEKINSKCLFGEFGHPADREEVDPDKIAIALTEVPKKNANGQLEACFDILDTPSGRILKTVCDYGAHIGISSRGSGDIIEEYGEEIVDPNTYYFECFDAVLLPAVKQARLNYMHESVDPKALKLRKALTEQLEKATEDDKKIMKETLKDLNIELEEEEVADWVDSEDQAIENESEKRLVEEGEETFDDSELAMSDEEVAEINEPFEDDEPNGVEEEPEEESNEESDGLLVKDIIAELSQYEDELPIEIKPIEIDGIKYDVNLEFIHNDDSIEIGVICDPIEGSNEDKEEAEDLPAEEIEADELAVENSEEANNEEAEEEVESEEAEDSGDDEEILESLKDIIRQKELLENEIKSLKRAEAVRDAKVNKLEEELNKYKNGFIRMSEVASTKSKVEQELSILKEQMTQKDSKIKKLEEQINVSNQLKEGLEIKKSKEVKKLNEELNILKAEKEASEQELTLQIKQAGQKIQENMKLAKQYKNKCSAILNKYIESKATMLGVNPKEITNRLNESYTLADIDTVCEDLLSYNIKMNNLPFGVKRNTTRVAESKQPVKQAPKTDGGYEIDDSLLELAGLK